MKKEVDPDNPGTGDPARSADASGAPPSNTAPTNYIQILRNGIDSIYLSYPGNLYPDKNNDLADKKVLAQSPIPLERQRPRFLSVLMSSKCMTRVKAYIPMSSVGMPIISSYRVSVRASSPWHMSRCALNI